MTKLKNTKKGMAKKALSISLVAAMLATSNVPVWAAEDLFSDGSAAVEAPVVEEPAAEVDTFSAEPEAPVVEEEVNDVATYAVANDAKLKLTDWTSQLTLEGKLADSEGNEITTGIDYVVRIDGMEVVDHTGTWKDTGKTVAELKSALAALQFKNTDAGHTVSVDITADDGKFKTTLAPITIEAADITGKVTFDLNADGNETKNLFNDELVYTGQEVAFSSKQLEKINYTTTNASYNTNYSGFTYADFTYRYVSDDLVNSTDLSKKTTTLVAEVTKEGYKGIVNTNNTLKINKRPISDTELELTLNKDALFYAEQENGVFPSETVTVKNTETGLVYPTSTYKVKFTGKSGKVNVGTEGTIDVIFDSTSLAKDKTINGNYKVTGSVTKTTTGNATVKANNISDFRIETDGITKDDYKAGKVASHIHYYYGDKDVTSIISSDIAVVAPELTEGATSATVTINPKTTNIIGSTTVTVNIAAKKIDAIISAKVNGNTLSSFNANTNLDNTIAYTGEEISLKISDLKTNANTTLVSDDYKIVYENKDRVNAKSVSGDRIQVKVVGTGDYTGSVDLGYFEIDQAEIMAADIKVPKSVQYDGSLTTAADYMDGKVTVQANTKVDGKEKKIDVPTDAYTLTYTLDPNSLAVGTKITTKLESSKIENKNFKIAGAFITVSDKTTISNKDLADENVKVEVVGGPYTYTGKAVIPTLKVTVDGVELALDRDYKVMATANSVNAGKASVLVLGINDYSGSQTVNYTIEKAKLSDLKVEADVDKDNYNNSNAFVYTGKQVKPKADNFKITLNGVELKSSDFAITYPTTSLVNVDAGEAKVNLVPVKDNENFTGDPLEVKFEILPAKLSTNELAGKFYAFDENGNKIEFNDSKYVFKYDGTEKTFKNVKYVLNSGKGVFNGTKLVEGKDYEIKYYNNITGPNAALYVTGIGNYVGNNKFEGSEKTYIQQQPFTIDGVTVDQRNMTLKDTEYAGGVATTPNLTIKVGEKTLVEGVDYKFVDLEDNAEVTPANKVLKATVELKGAYTFTNGFKWSGAFDNSTVSDKTKKVVVTWKIVKKDLANTKVIAEKKADDLTVIVYNGNVIVPETEYDVKDNGDGTVTVTAKADSKGYTGSQKVTVEENDVAVGAPVISEVKISGNKATVVLEGEAEGATGYDYVISTVNDYQNGRLPDGIHKNQLVTETTYQYLDQGIYYAYCHAWTRDENGKKVFGEWSNIMPFSVSAITPEKPVITSVKKSGRNLTVTWTKSDNATGYDIVMGTEMRKVNGELRPVEYGKAVKKITNGNTVTVTFRSIPKGTYYVGLHAYNRTSETGVKVFSPWSNAKKVTF